MTDNIDRLDEVERWLPGLHRATNLTWIPEYEELVRWLIEDDRRLRAEVSFWKKRAAIEGEATVNAAEATEGFRAEIERYRRLQVKTPPSLW